MKKNFYSKTLLFYVVLIILLSVLVAVVNLGWQKSFIGDDPGVGLQFPQIKSMIQLYTWDNLSAPGKLNVTGMIGFLWINFIFVLSKIGLVPFIIERLVYTLFFSASGLGMFFLSNLLLTKKNDAKNSPARYFGSFSASLLYMFNPYSMFLISFPISAYEISYMLLPLILGLFVYNLRIKTSLISICAFIIAAVILSGGNPSNSISIALLLLFYLLFFAKDIKRSSAKPIRFFSVSFILFLCLMAYVYLPMISAGGNPYGKVSFTKDFQASFGFNSLRTSFLNLFRMDGLKIWPNFDYYKLYANNYFFTFLSFLIPIVALFSVFFKKGRKTKIFFLFVLVVSLFFAKGIQPLFAKLFLFFASKIPYFEMYRNVYAKFGFYIVLSYAVLIGYTAMYLFKMRGNFNKRLRYSFLLIPFMICLYAKPIFTGGAVRGEYFSEIPKDYKNLSQSLNEFKTDYKILTMPPTPKGRGPILKWNNDIYIGADPDKSFLKKPALDSYWFIAYGLIEDNSWDDLVFAENVNSILKYLKLLNIRQIFLHKDFVNTYKFNPNGRTHKIKGKQKAEIINHNLSRFKGIKLIKETNYYNLYNLPQKCFLPHVYSTQDAYIVDGGIHLLNSLSATKHLKRKPALFFIKQQQNQRPEGRADISKLVYTNNKWGLLDEFNNYGGNKSPEITFKRINPTKYLVKVEGAAEPFWLVFSESFHEQWKLYEGKRIKEKGKSLFGEIVGKYEHLGVKEARHQMRFTPSDIKFLLEEPLNAEHHLVNGYANSWYVEPEKLGLGEDFALTIYFKPQSWFYLGLGISGLTLLGCIGYLFFYLFKHKKNKK